MRHFAYLKSTFSLEPPTPHEEGGTGWGTEGLRSVTGSGWWFGW